MRKFEINSPQYINHQKKEANYKRILSLIIKDVKGYENFIPTLVDLQLSKDSSHLVIYLSFDHYEKKALEHFNNAKGFVRSELARNISARYTPDITFKLDEASKNGRNIDAILKKLEEENGS
ncbi:30S ribosome-binding factor RbfA [[Mycoplasma] mobile]|uniref:Ribosome-binding factor a n=1 Tax=Mycoplasma mobile (strain ATCC 43663 / 163K / NCTC 11711) TaxID=267748 RepID=Q6KID7_MYCM1|nr:30S ribosome-binding factor RbfA [[Mycoplasma] mobile]AAT27639.1 ribosome-binding factor a [Mycoplasma mobile 163K]